MHASLNIHFGRHTWQRQPASRSAEMVDRWRMHWSLLEYLKSLTQSRSRVHRHSMPGPYSEER
jgi:hypothetical protein